MKKVGILLIQLIKLNLMKLNKIIWLKCKWEIGTVAAAAPCQFPIRVMLFVDQFAARSSDWSRA